MKTSIFLAKVIGLVSVISAAAALTHYKDSLAFEEEALKSSLSIYLSGFVIFILGVLLVVSHSVWTSDWRLVITIIGWLVLLKGAGRIFFPDAVVNLIKKKRNSSWSVLGEIIVFVIGLYLLYYGFIVH